MSDISSDPDYSESDFLEGDSSDDYRRPMAGDISSVIGTCHSGSRMTWCATHDSYLPLGGRCIAKVEREAVDAFIRDELPVLLTKATADYAMTYDGWFADQDGPILAAQIAALRTS